MQKWEFKRLFMPVQANPNTKQRDHTFWNIEYSDNTNKAWAEAESLGNDGWELIGIAQEIGGHEGTSSGAGSSYTTGYILFFKRPKE